MDLRPIVLDLCNARAVDDFLEQSILYDSLKDIDLENPEFEISILYANFVKLNSFMIPVEQGSRRIDTIDLAFKMCKTYVDILSDDYYFI